MTEAVPGSEQIADIGTKPMTAPKLREMRKMLGMGTREEEVEERVEWEKGAEDESEETRGEVQARDGLRSEDLERAANLIRIASILGAWVPVEAQAEEDSEVADDLWKVLVVVLLAMIGVAAVGVSLAGRMRRWCKKREVTGELRSLRKS